MKRSVLCLALLASMSGSAYAQISSPTAAERHCGPGSGMLECLFKGIPGAFGETWDELPEAVGDTWEGVQEVGPQVTATVVNAHLIVGTGGTIPKDLLMDSGDEKLNQAYRDAVDAKFEHTKGLPGKTVSAYTGVPAVGGLIIDKSFEYFATQARQSENETEMQEVLERVGTIRDRVNMATNLIQDGIDLQDVFGQTSHIAEKVITATGAFANFSDSINKERSRNANRATQSKTNTTMLNAISQQIQSNTSHFGNADRGFVGTRVTLEAFERNKNRTTIQENPYLAEGSTIIKAPADIVLNWGTRPADLDSHLTGPLNANGDTFHVNFENLGSLDGNPNVLLYRDDTDHHFGGANRPEQTRINVTQPGKYNFYVHDFSNRNSTNSTALSESGAVVTLHSAGNRDLPEGGNLGRQVARFEVPTNRVGTVWHTFELDTRRNTIREIKDNNFYNAREPASVPKK